MKTTNMLAMVAAAMLAAGSYAADTAYKVYDVAISLKTTKAGKTVAADCGEEYAYRERGTRKIKGVVAGCGCLTMLADPTCSNFKIYFWDETSKTQITNFEFSVSLAQRIGKKQTTFEHMATLAVEDGTDLLMAGFGTYRRSKSGANYDTATASGNVVGLMAAPYVAGKQSCCGEEVEAVQTKAFEVCVDGSCSEASDSGLTPAYGSYTMKPNTSKASKCAKKGVTAKNLGLPSYVDFRIDNAEAAD